MKPIIDKYLPLSSSTSISFPLAEERKKDHYSHFILRLAFAATESLRQRFVRVESQLFQMRWQNDDQRERRGFTKSLELNWEMINEQEKGELREQLLSATDRFGKREKDVLGEGWFKVDWMMVPELVAKRKVFIKGGMAYVPGGEQMSMVVHEFENRLAKALEVSFSPLLFLFISSRS